MDRGAGKRRGSERRGGSRGRRGRGGEGVEKCRVAFWNVVELRSKDWEFWKGLEEWEMIVLCETWVKERDWECVRNRLPKGYMWWKQWA